MKMPDVAANKYLNLKHNKTLKNSGLETLRLHGCGLPRRVFSEAAHACMLFATPFWAMASEDFRHLWRYGHSCTFMDGTKNGGCRAEQCKLLVQVL